MATSYAKLKQYSDAKKAAEIAVKFSPKLKEGHLNLGLSELHLGNEKIAEKIFYHVVKKHHDYFSAILLLASSQLCQGKTKEAANNLKPLRDSPVWNRISYAIQDLVESLNDAGWIELTRNLIAGSIALECSNRKIMEYHHQFENMAA